MALRLTAGRVLAAAALAAVAGCGGIHDLRVPSEPNGGAAFMERYVAIGNSITAGYQSGGISDSTQRRSYAHLVARAAGTRFAIPSLAGAGCAPASTAINAFRGAAGDNTWRPAGSSCARISTTDLLSNVAVPGARSADPTGTAGGGPNALTTLILGGQTQVQRALAADPTFVSIWIGNNDVLASALAGDATTATPTATFTANYDAMLAAVTAPSAAVPKRAGILIGVVDVTAIGALFPAAAIVNNVGGFRTAIQQALLGGRSFQIINCPANTTSLVSMAYLLQAASSTANPVPFACSPTPVSPTVTIGTSGILDASEIAIFKTRVAEYNAHIQSKATELGWAYLDPNPILAQYRATGAITPVPVLTSPTAPFGTALSLDGIHPSSSTHVDAANAIIAAINAKYGTTIPAATAITP